jgi:hypothetical protein
LKLPIATGMFAQGERFAGLATAQMMPFEELGNDGNTHLEAQGAKLPSDLGSREIGPQRAFLIGIAGRAGIEDFQERFVETRPERQAATPATPFFRARWGGSVAGPFVNSAKPRWTVLRWQSKSRAT